MPTQPIPPTNPTPIPQIVAPTISPYRRNTSKWYENWKSRPRVSGSFLWSEMVITNIAIHNDLVAGVDEIFALLRRQNKDSPIRLEEINAKRIQLEMALTWMLSIKIAPKQVKPSRKPGVKLMRPLGIYYSSLYELSRQRVGENAPNLFLECLYDNLLLRSEPELEEPGKSGHVKAKRKASAFLTDEIAAAEPIDREKDPFLWLMQQSAWEAERHDGWGTQYWHSAQRRRWPENATPFVNAWGLWLRHVEREKGLATTVSSGDRLMFSMRGGHRKPVFTGK